MIRNVTAEEALRAVGDTVLLDVREQWEFDIVHLPGATLIPLSSIPFRLKEVPADKTIIVYCHTGVRSQQACMFLQDKGWQEVFNLEGGIDACSAIDESLEKY
jgi:rhodanese-related sulfurtransferase